jgi:hypothetical protein
MLAPLFILAEYGPVPPAIVYPFANVVLKFVLPVPLLNPFCLIPYLPLANVNDFGDVALNEGAAIAGFALPPVKLKPVEYPATSLKFVVETAVL